MQDGVGSIPVGTKGHECKLTASYEMHWWILTMVIGGMSSKHGLEQKKRAVLNLSLNLIGHGVVKGGLVCVLGRGMQAVTIQRSISAG